MPEKIQSGLIVAAFALLFGLMIFATYNDILRLITCLLYTSVLDGDAHIGHAQLGADGVIAVLHGRVDNALALHPDLALLGGQAEQPDRLDQLQALVHPVSYTHLKCQRPPY